MENLWFLVLCSGVLRFWFWVLRSGPQTKNQAPAPSTPEPSTKNQCLHKIPPTVFHYGNLNARFLAPGGCPYSISLETNVI